MICNLVFMILTSLCLFHLSSGILFRLEMETNLFLLMSLQFFIFSFPLMHLDLNLLAYFYNEAKEQVCDGLLKQILCFVILGSLTFHVNFVIALNLWDGNYAPFVCYLQIIFTFYFMHFCLYFQCHGSTSLRRFSSIAFSLVLSQDFSLMENKILNVTTKNKSTNYTRNRLVFKVVSRMIVCIMLFFLFSYYIKLGWGLYKSFEPYDLLVVCDWCTLLMTSKCR